MNNTERVSLASKLHTTHPTTAQVLLESASLLESSDPVLLHNASLLSLRTTSQSFQTTAQPPPSASTLPHPPSPNPAQSHLWKGIADTLNPSTDTTVSQSKQPIAKTVKCGKFRICVVSPSPATQKPPSNNLVKALQLTDEALSSQQATPLTKLIHKQTTLWLAYELMKAQRNRDALLYLASFAQSLDAGEEDALVDMARLYKTLITRDGRVELTDPVALFAQALMYYEVRGNPCVQTRELEQRLLDRLEIITNGLGEGERVMYKDSLEKMKAWLLVLQGKQYEGFITLNGILS
ncbi:hypothetical protein BCR33DRAFT_735818 [Rhizoclosmatium globosum]|uniref:Uncharacterized protein n=1 Tax=Rhizoclosmatium globosum TaxID=329046 RepID=A0A1Y2CKS6_9FUNG|nr:hypothetical protein BCR33DRAFT_735818 [Rhizoclosmatium globosum]|eukprot:ORY47619.1 hypothetical protein BCR33DRAFT_735818 [Rhizoclosmatium globosum]